MSPCPSLHPSALRCSHGISQSAGVCCVLTLPLLWGWEEHLRDVSCLGVYPSVCKDQAVCPCPFPGCFNGALAVLLARVGKTTVWEKWRHVYYLTEGNIELMNTTLFLSSWDSRAVCKDLLWCMSLTSARSLRWSEVSQGHQQKCNAMLRT